MLAVSNLSVNILMFPALEIRQRAPGQKDEENFYSLVVRDRTQAAMFMSAFLPLLQQ